MSEMTPPCDGPGIGERAARFGVLGPLLFAPQGTALQINSGKQRAVLAVLLLRANQTVSSDRLIDELWGAHPPPSARSLVATYVWRLRRLLEDSPAKSARLLGEPAGYRLRVGEGELDLAEFDRLSAQGRTLLFAGNAINAAAALRAALDLWRGDPLADVPLYGELASEVAQLAEQRTDALESRIEADLAAGRPDSLIGELRRLVEQHPNRERLAVFYMTALYQSGRRADALTVFQRVSARLADGLGIDPGEELNAVHQAILRADAGLRAPIANGGERAASAWPLTDPIRPAQLPAADEGFRGRQAELDALDGLLDDHRSGGAWSPLVVVIAGPGGVGKTSLAVQWAHRNRDRFPDGQLFAALGTEHASGRSDALPVLRRFLRALGLSADQTAVGLEEATAQFRTVLANRRVLILLDDASDAAAAAALLPGNRTSAVLLTSRDPLRELTVRHGAKQIKLRPFSAEESRALLSGVAAPGRFRDQSSTNALIDICGHLPLALRLAAAHLDEHDTLAVGEYVARLHRGDKFAELGDENGGVRGAFELSYRTLPRADARGLRLLGLVAAHDVTAPAVAALLDLPDIAAERILGRLARARLLDRSTSGRRYAIHDVLREYATDLAQAEESAESRDQALSRWLDWHLESAVAADRILDPYRYREPPARSATSQPPPALATLRDALGWLDAERGNLVAAVFQAARNRRPGIAWRLAWALFSYFDLRKPWTDWVDTYRLGASCARTDGDAHGEAVMMYGLGTAYYYPQRFGEALDCYRRALRLHRETGDRRGEGMTLNCIGNVQLETRAFDKALSFYAQALHIHRRDGNRRDEGVVLNNLSETYAKLARYQEAELCAREALEIQREVDNRRVEVLSLCHLANALWGLDRDPAAVSLLREALALSDDIGETHGRSWALTYLGQVMRDDQRWDQARHCWREAATLFTQRGDPNVADVRARLANLDRESSK